MSRTYTRCTAHFQSSLTFLQSWNPWIMWVGKSFCYHWIQQVTQHHCVRHWTISPSATSMSFECPQGWLQCLKCANSSARNLNICEISISDGSLLYLLHLQEQHSNAEFLWLPALFLVALCSAGWTNVALLSVVGTVKWVHRLRVVPSCVCRVFSVQLSSEFRCFFSSQLLKWDTGLLCAQGLTY